MTITEDMSLMRLNQVQWLVDQGVAVRNAEILLEDVVSELKVELEKFKFLTYTLHTYPSRKHVVKITNSTGKALEEKEFDHVYHVVKFVKSKK